MKNIKEEILKESVKPVYVSENDMLSEHPKDEDDVEINSSDMFYEMVGYEDLRKAIDLTLAEIGKVIDEEIKTEQECMKKDKYEEQEIEHINQIEMANKIKQKLGIK